MNINREYCVKVSHHKVFLKFGRCNNVDSSNIIIIIIIIIIIMITITTTTTTMDLYSAFRSEDTEALDAAQED